MMSYTGWFDATDTHDAYKEYIKPYFTKRNARKRIGKHDKAEAKKEREKMRRDKELAINGIRRG